MSRKKVWIWMTLALACAVGAAAVAFFTLQNRVEAVERSAPVALPTPTPIPTVKLPVAARNLDAGTVLTTTDILVVEFPMGLVPSSAISSTEMLTQQMLGEPVAKGDFFRSSALLGSQSGPISEQIEQGKTLVAYPIVDPLGQTGLIRDGDHVDMLLTVAAKGANAEAQGHITGYTVQNAQVFRVLHPPKTESNPDPKPTMFVLLLTPQDAVMFKLVKDSGGTIDLGLRSPLDKEPFNAPSATDLDLERTLNPGGASPR